MRKPAIAVLGPALVAGCGTGAPTAAQVERETARLDEWFEARFEEQLDFSPIQKTLLGRKEDYDRACTNRQM